MSNLFDLEPEEVFKMVTVMPKKKIKVTAYLEDSDGDRITFKEISSDLVEFIEESMKETENNPINSQMFPLTAQFMTSIVPRFVGNNVAAFLFAAPSFRRALSMLTLSTALLMQYIQQHNLKIVTETEELSDEDIELFNLNQERASEDFEKMFGNRGLEDMDLGEEPDDDE